MKDHFEEKSKEWDAGQLRLQLAITVAEAIKREVVLSSTMEIIDFGVGTGLLGFEIAKEVKKVYGVDTSASMLCKLEDKNSSELSIEAINQDIIKEPLNLSVDGIISSMTLHHVEDTKAFFSTIYNNLIDGGFIALADLESEDGSFHPTGSEGIFHTGFDEVTLISLVEKCGFKKVEVRNIHKISKADTEYGIFLLTAYK